MRLRSSIRDTDAAVASMVRQAGLRLPSLWAQTMYPVVGDARHSHSVSIMAMNPGREDNR